VVLLLVSRVQRTLQWNRETERLRLELGQRQAVLVPKEDIPAGVALTQEIIDQKIESRDYLQQHLPANAVADASALVGKVVLAPLYAKEPILAVRLGKPEDIPSVSYTLPQGKVAFALPTSSERAVGGEIRARDHIDIIAPADQGVQVLLGNVLVLGRPSDFARAVSTVGGEADEAGAGFVGASGAIPFVAETGGNVLILELAPEDAVKLAGALNEGDVFVALRSSR
jgi:Flp pilus assembly protein CpaB